MPGTGDKTALTPALVEPGGLGKGDISRRSVKNQK